MKKDKIIDRRNFMKGSAVAAGSMMFSGLTVERAAYVDPPENEIKLALIGCGGRGTGAAMQALSTGYNVKLVAMADAFRDQIDKSYQALTSDEIHDWSGATGNIRDRISVEESAKFSGFDAYKKAISMADVVILATPPGFRPYHLEEALKQNKHVFTEKPLATDGPGIRRIFEMIKLADEKKLNVVVGLQRHCSRKYIEITRRIHDGMIGDIVSGQVYYDSEGVWVRERKPEYSEMEFQMRNWYYFTWLCGDHIVEQHIHNIDSFNWAKQGYPVSAQGMGGRAVRTGKEFGEIYDHHFVEFGYADGSYMNSQCRHIKGCMNKVGEQLVGTKGMARFDRGRAYIADHAGQILYDHRDQDDPNPYQVEHDELFSAISRGVTVNNLLNGAESTLTVLMGRFATYSGQVVSREEVLNSTIRLMPENVDWDDNPPSTPGPDGFYAIPKPGVYKVI